MAEKFSPYGFSSLLLEHNVIMCFQGAMTQEVLSIIAATLKKKSVSSVIGRRLFGIVIELAQNINYYSAQRTWSEAENKEVGSGIVAVSETRDKFTISSGNFIGLDTVRSFGQRCDYVNSLDIKSVIAAQEQYKNSGTESPGANLGLIDMRRKSGNALRYAYFHTPDDPNNDFFTLTVTVDKNIDV